MWGVFRMFSFGSPLSGLVLLCLGCHSTPTNPSGQFASVDLHNNTPGQIRAVALEVFKTDGYTLAEGSTSRDYVFEKEGSSIDNLAYGNWIGTPIWVRFKVHLVPISEATFRLQGDAFLVRGKGEPAEEEIKVKHASSYQKILNQVAQRLHDHPPSSVN
jgi:hypothetical protein